MKGYRAYKIQNFFTELFAPVEYKCLNCGKDVFDQVGFCDECRKLLPFNNGKKCLRCGVEIDGEENYCGNCALDKVYFDKAYSAFNYDGIIKTAILRMKFGNLGSYARVLARYLVFIAQSNNLQYDVVCYVPMSQKSFKKRKYNQSKLLSQAFCDILEKYDILIDALEKHKETVPQERLGRKERKQNLIGSYKMAQGADVKGKRVLLIDDVKTTGATINECAKVLKHFGGATSVVALTVASRKEHLNYEIDAEYLQ